MWAPHFNLVGLTLVLLCSRFLSFYMIICFAMTSKTVIVQTNASIGVLVRVYFNSFHSVCVPIYVLPEHVNDFTYLESHIRREN